MRNWETLYQSRAAPCQGTALPPRAPRAGCASSPGGDFAQEPRFLCSPASMTAGSSGVFPRAGLRAVIIVFVVRKVPGCACSLEGFRSALLFRLFEHFSSVKDLIP